MMSSALLELYDMAGQQWADAPPTLRFFTATDRFWQVMGQFVGVSVVEFGAGTGETVQEARTRGYRWSGCDHRTGPESMLRGVHRMNALRIPLEEGMVAIACRPDHSGWSGPALERALDEGCTAIYVSKESNVIRDIGNLLTTRSFEVHEGVGEEGESLWLFRPSHA